MIIEIFFVAVTTIYLAVHILLLKGLRISLSLKKNKSHVYPKVSVIVAARNEEQNIGTCIKSLLEIEYPLDSLEVILVNDNSSDRTLEIMKELTLSHEYFKVINSRSSTSKNLKGKANAIDTAIEQCTGQIIVSTDADCVVPKYWVSETVNYYYEHTAMICGFTSIQSDNSLFAKLQCIDWMYLLALASSSSGLHKTLSCLGNNLSFTKSAYYKVGGYETINFSVTEDLALMRKISSEKELEILFPVDQSCLVRTLPCKNLRELFSQKRRWFRGGIGINFLGYIIGFELYTMSILFVFGIIFLSFELYLLLMAIKIISELILISKVLNRFDMKSMYKYYPLFSLYFAFYGLMLPISFLFGRKIKWKGQKF